MSAGRDHGRFTHDDPGLQPERTTLSWLRTACAVLIPSLLLVRIGDPALTVPLVALFTTAVTGILATAMRRHPSRVIDFRNNISVPAALPSAGLTGVVVSLAVAALIAINAT
ncbi:DUF202 domain-containing protein [Rhodococcus gannanensis]|uniref:DUF202 domain-containing protein n=1 Tax=Rhodococcus gannanensis TaxID=1960308 RepID=A0ABW4NX92_9NOCA